MTTRLDLPDGQWAVLAEPRKVQERKRRGYIAAMTDLAAVTVAGGLPSRQQVELADQVGDALILCLVQEWSFGPVDPETLAGLTTECFDPIFKACRDRSGDLLPDYSPDIDPKAPTGGSTLPPPPPSTEGIFATLSSDGIS